MRSVLILHSDARLHVHVPLHLGIVEDCLIVCLEFVLGARRLGGLLIPCIPLWVLLVPTVSVSVSSTAHVRVLVSLLTTQHVRALSVKDRSPVLLMRVLMV